VGQEKINRIDESAVKAVGAFGGGIASSGSVCGILLGGIALISSIYSRGNLDEKENPRIWALSSKFLKKFEEMTEPYGTMDCRDIAGVDWKNRDAVKEYYKNPESNRKICIKLVGEAAAILGELLEQEEARPKAET
jgi:C_GCAxxG_C_C family probable redox protein